MKNISKLAYVVAGMLLAAGMSYANIGIGKVVKLNSAKPVADVAVSDEQQAILAVRKVKAATINIVGTPAQKQTSTGISFAPETVSGTGFIIDPDGIIVSNNHVVADSSFTYSVIFADGTEYPATVMGLDKFDDVAVLKIDAHNLPTVQFGNSDALETGQSVFAIGNSLGRYQNSVTRGVVSGLGRVIGMESGTGTPRLQNLIQTDAAISPGNSGGPLINLTGEVVGMNTLFDAGGSSLGFAVPASVIKSAVDQIKMYGKVSKPYMGITFSTITKILKAQYDLPLSEGALVASVTEGGPAAQAGMRGGDIVTEINREKLTSVNELDKVVAKYQAGTQILVTYVRDGKTYDAALVLGSFK